MRSAAERVKLALPKENRDQVKRMLRAVSRGLDFAHSQPKSTIEIIEREWKVERAVAEGSSESVVKGLSKTGIPAEAGLKMHMQLMRKVDKAIGDVPFLKMVESPDPIRRHSLPPLFASEPAANLTPGL